MRLSSLQDTDIDDTPRDTSSRDDDLATIWRSGESLSSEDKFLDHDIFEGFWSMHGNKLCYMNYYGMIIALFYDEIDFLSENNRLSSDPDIEECEPPSKYLSDIDAWCYQDTHIRGSISDRFNLVMTSDKEGPFDMEGLGNDRHAPRQRKYFLCSDNRVEGPESSIVKRDSTLGDPSSHQGFLHELRFIVTHSTIISRDEYMMDLPSLIEHLRRLDTRRIKEVHSTAVRRG